MHNGQRYWAVRGNPEAARRFARKCQRKFGYTIYHQAHNV